MEAIAEMTPITDADQNDLRNRFNALLAETGWTVNKVAGMTEIVSQGMLSDWQKGRKNLGDENWVLLDEWIKDQRKKVRKKLGFVMREDGDDTMPDKYKRTQAPWNFDAPKGARQVTNAEIVQLLSEANQKNRKDIVEKVAKLSTHIAELDDEIAGIRNAFNELREAIDQPPAKDQ